MNAQTEQHPGVKHNIDGSGLQILARIIARKIWADLNPTIPAEGPCGSLGDQQENLATISKGTKAHEDI